MLELAFVFPGQGSQKVGMGAAFSQEFPEARSTFDEADAVLGWRLSQLCFEGPEETLKQTEKTQLAILTCSIAAFRILQSLDISPIAVAGHSLGEYSALVAAQVLDFSDVLKLVESRARFMAEASQAQKGTMAAILGLEEDTLQAFCKDSRSAGVVTIANYNCPGQLVISGEIEAVDRVIELAKEKVGARRCLKLPVSGAFHSPLMTAARDQLASVIDDFTFRPPQAKLVVNVTGESLSTPDDIRQMLIHQVTSAVQWERSIRTMANTNISHFVEVGPGKVLSGMVRRIQRDAVCLNVEDLESLQQTIESANLRP